MNFSPSRGWRRAPLAALLAVLAGCGEFRPSLADVDGDKGLCAPLPEPRQQAATDSYQQAVQRDECIHRFGYAFAAAPDPADSVVGAVIGACRAQIDRSATMLGEGDPEAERWFLEQMERAARERALYRVIQARAGNCS